ncbi:MAG TPA: rhodanese-like domain-containing protein [Anaeromyxobacteraceae bacterium]|nr:rhodanese-like domain-containing protein [Anaeromyxobacteraceae bacterium]
MTLRSLALAAALALAGCLHAAGGGEAAPRSDAGGAAGAAPVTGDAARALVGAGARLVDVRTPEEFAAGHLPRAVNVPYDEIAERIAEIGPPATPVVVYCRSGRRAARAAEALRGLGYGEVHDLGPMSAWPVDAAGVPLPPVPAARERP